LEFVILGQQSSAATLPNVPSRGSTGNGHKLPDHIAQFNLNSRELQGLKYFYNLLTTSAKVKKSAQRSMLKSGFFLI
jgi:hypothetical protein